MNFHGKKIGIIGLGKSGYWSAKLASSLNCNVFISDINLDINHPDIHEYLEIRRPKGDPNRQCLNLHQCVVIDDAFMQKLEYRDAEAMELWVKILKSRVETGEPYIMYGDNVNNANPPAYKKNNLDV